MVEILETAPDLSPDPLTIKIVDQRNGSGVKNTGEPQRGVLGHFRMILSCKLQAASFKQQAA